MVRVVDYLRVAKGALGHDPAVPERGPPLVHDLGLALREEVVGLVADDPERLVLPGFQRGVVEQELEDVADGTLRGAPRAARVLLELLALSLEELRRIHERLHVRLALEPAG